MKQAIINVTVEQPNPLVISTMRKVYDAIYGKNVPRFNFYYDSENDTIVYTLDWYTEDMELFTVQADYEETHYTVSFDESTYQATLSVPYSNDSNQSHTYSLAVFFDDEKIFSFTVLDTDVKEHSITVEDASSDVGYSFDGELVYEDYDTVSSDNTRVLL